jgi:hypothetical protein
MTSKTDSYSLPPAVRRIATYFRVCGWISFWVQAILALVSGAALGFAVVSLSFRGGTETSGSPGTGSGLFLAVCGLIALCVGAYWAFRYTRLSRRLRSPDSRGRPKPGDVIQALRIGLTINLVGMLLTLLGAEAIVGSLLARTFSQSGAIYEFGRNPQFIQAADIFIVQANTNTVLAHFVGVVASLWLVRCMSRQ